MRASRTCSTGAPPRSASTDGRNYDAFRQARPAAAGTRHPVTCHQHARGCRAPAATTGKPSGDPPKFRTDPLAAAPWRRGLVTPRRYGSHRRVGSSPPTARVSHRMTLRDLLGEGPDVDVVALAYD